MWCCQLCGCAFAHGYEDGHHSEASPDVSTAVECCALLQWDAARCVNGGYPHGENDVVCFRFHGGKWHASVCILGYPIFRHVNHGYGMLWDVMSQHGLKTHRLWWIHINSTLRTIPLHVTGTYFDRFSHDFQMISDPKSFQNDPKNRIPDATWLTGSLGLGTAQRQAASAAERIEGGAMCPRRKFTTFPCWTSWKAAFLFIFSLDHPRSWVLSLSYTVISYYIDCEILVLETSFLRPKWNFFTSSN